MEQETKKKNKKPLNKSSIAIIILSILILLAAGAGYWQYAKFKEKLTVQTQRASDLEPDTVKVERGDLETNLDDISGTVRSNQSVYLYWQISGTVADVNVEVGDEVKKGDILAELDRSTIDTSVIQAELTQETAEESLERLFVSPLKVEQARSEMVQAMQTLDDAQDERNKLGIVRARELDVGVKYEDWQKTINAYNQAVDKYESVKFLDLDNVDRIRAVNQLESAKKAMDSAKAQYNWYNGEADELEVQQADAAVKLAEANLADKVRAYNRIKDGPTDNQVRSLQAQIDAARATSNNARIIAPIDGTVAQVEAHPFDVITYESTSTARDILAVRIDDLTSHYIDFTVSEQDINSISLGQKVTITFDAIPLKEYSGTIYNISNAGTISNLSVSYALTVKMDEADDSIKSGMMADISIITQKVENCLFVPSKALMPGQDGKRVVKKVNTDGSVTEIPVETGLTSGSNVQIISSQLQEGDTVQLMKTAAMIGQNNGLFGNMFGGGMGGPGGGMGGPGGGRPNGGPSGMGGPGGGR